MDTHIRFDEKALALHLLDQRRLPTEQADFVCTTTDHIIEALKVMVVRGAPAIGVTAAFGCVIAVAQCIREGAGQGWQGKLSSELARIADARPTAVNLSWAVDRMRTLWQEAGDVDAPALLQLFIEKAKAMQAEDIAICRKLGLLGGRLLHDGDTVLTHCNAGALATAGYGTALGVIRGAIEAGKRISVIADETRPFLQGARLTAWELARDNIPVTVACDNACALLMSKGKVNAVVVGADRIAANGDTANKIGTFGVALLAAHFHIPFYVAAPLSTIDRNIASGNEIPIEERPDSEVRIMTGQPIVPANVPVYNYAFDVTPAKFITAIITEAGILAPPFGETIATAFAGALA